MGFIVTDDLFVKNMGVMYNGGYMPGSGGIVPGKNETVACRTSNEALLMNMDGYHIDDSNLIQMVSADGDKLELGEVEIKIHNAPVLTEESNRKTQEKADLEKKYGVHGPIFIDRTTEYEDETEGSLTCVNIDKLIFSAHAKAEGISDNKCKMIFNTDSLAKKLYTFFEAKGDFLGDPRAFAFSEDDLEAIEQLKSQMDNIFNELVSNIQNGKGDSVRALEGKLAIKGFELTLGEALDIKDGFNSIDYMKNGKTTGHFAGIIGDYTTAGVVSSYFKTYVNEYLSGDAAKLANETYDAYLKKDIATYDEFMSTAPVKPGAEYRSNNAIFSGSHKEDLFNILANMDTSSEEAWKNGLSDAINKAIDFEYDIIISRGASDSLAKRWTDSTRMWINQALARMTPMDKIRTVF